MRKMDLTLWALARCPFLPADDLAHLAGTGVRAARAHLARLDRRGLVDDIHPPGTRLRLYYLTSAGVGAAARAAESEPAILAGRYGLNERALLRRLPALERLVASRRVLLMLHAALAARNGALEAWRAWPVLWPYSEGPRRRVLSLDGEGAVRLPTRRAELRPFGFLWDGDATVPAAALADRLARLDRLMASPTYTGPRSPHVPPVLLVTVAAERVPPGYRPGLLWTTAGELARDGALDTPWRGSDLGDEALPLPGALAVGSGAAMLGVPVTRGDATAAARLRGRHRRLQERIDGLRDGAGEDAPQYLVAPTIPPRGVAILEIVGRHPLLAARDVAVACALNPVDVWDVLGVLRRHGLVEGWMPPGQHRTRRYVLTARGLRLLAARVGLAPDAYRRVYASLDDTAGRARRGLRFAQRNLAHTDGINRAYLALLATTRMTGGSLDWRGEWACARRYTDGSRLRTLRPDADVRYTEPAGGQMLFIEIDRGTKRLVALAAKLAQYGAYRASAGHDQVTILLVTTGYERGWELLCLNETLPDQAGMPPLDLLVTTRAEVKDRGAQARIWRATSAPCETLTSALPRCWSVNRGEHEQREP